MNWRKQANVEDNFTVLSKTERTKTITEDKDLISAALGFSQKLLNSKLRSDQARKSFLFRSSGRVCQDGSEMECNRQNGKLDETAPPAAI